MIQLLFLAARVMLFWAVGGVRRCAVSIIASSWRPYCRGGSDWAVYQRKNVANIVGKNGLAIRRTTRASLVGVVREKAETRTRTRWCPVYMRYTEIDDRGLVYLY